ncbi:MAG: pyruvate, water dikinase regulatory protein [Pseudomonadota bacterium]
MTEPPMRVHIVSDSTGETGYAVAKATLARFAPQEFSLEVSVFIRSETDMAQTLARLEAMPGPVFHTLARSAHRTRLEAVAQALGVPAVSVLDVPLTAMAAYLGRAPGDRPGMQHQVNDAYFERIAALDFAIAHDDGALGERLKAADVILTGVSRTSKTPTCIYLAYRGIRAANLPLVPGRPIPEAFGQALSVGVLAVGLTASPARLAHVREQRLEALGDRSPGYAELDQIRDEVAEARLFFERHNLPVIDVTRRSIEETAAAVQALLSAHRAAFAPPRARGDRAGGERA